MITILRSMAKHLIPDERRIWLQDLLAMTRVSRLERNVAQLNRTVGAILHPPECPTINDYEYRITSQNGEDGILMWLFSVIGTIDRRFVEFGVSDSSECNTRNLFDRWGWSGLLIEGDEKWAARARDGTPANVNVACSYVTAENINGLIGAAGLNGEIDLLSIDVDGNDYWIWKATEIIQPRVVVVEYNASFGPTALATVPYEANRVPNFGYTLENRLYFGASLALLASLGTKKGYELIGCDSAGVNAFFVRQGVPGRPNVVSVRDAWRPNAHLTGWSQQEQEAALMALPLGNDE